MFLSDLHIHSTFSDGKLSIPEIVDLYGSKGFGAIAITDHLCESGTLLGKAAVYTNRTLTPATFPLYLEILRTEKKRAWEKYKMVLIAGFELTKNSVVNHSSARIIGLGIKEFMPADGDVESLARAIRAQGALAIAGHTHHLWDRREELKGCFDAWEVSAGRHLYTEVIETSLPKISASGMHHPKRLSSWKTVFFCERSEAAILEAIRAQDLCFTFYDETLGEKGLNDVHDWIDVSGARFEQARPKSVRNIPLPKALRALQVRRRRRQRAAERAQQKVASGLNAKAAQGRAKRSPGKSRELP